SEPGEAAAAASGSAEPGEESAGSAASEVEKNVEPGAEEASEASGPSEAPAGAESTPGVPASPTAYASPPVQAWPVEVPPSPALNPGWAWVDTVATPSQPEPPKRRRSPFRGSRFDWTHSATTTLLGIGADYQ